MGCSSSSPKKWVPEHNITNTDMGSEGLQAPVGSFPALGSQQRISTSSQGSRKKVVLKPGHSLMDWIKLGRSGKDLTGVGGRQMEVTLDELKKHNTEKDCWIAVRGKVYNVSAYLDFHPGGVEELMRGAGKDATGLFDEVHKWVNAESMLEKCLIGKLKDSNSSLRSKVLRKVSNPSNSLPNGGFLAPSTPPIQVPRFDWFQSEKTVSAIVYTKWPEMTEDRFTSDLSGRTLTVNMYIKQSVFTVHIELEREILEDFKVNVSQDSGKVELVLEKKDVGIQWASIGKYLDKHNSYKPCLEFNPAYRDCSIESVEEVTRDTRLFKLRLPHGSRLPVPTGYHVHIRHEIEGMEVVRSYTAVLPSLQCDGKDENLRHGKLIYLMVKIYPDGALTPWLGSLKQGELISVRGPDGNFDLSRLRSCSHLVMFAAGTGFTPMVKLLHETLVLGNKANRNVKLLFFNKTESDILWREQLCALQEKHDRFTYTNCLSEGGDSWVGLKGRVTMEMVKEFLPPVSGGDDKLLICVCGPTPFTKAVIQYAEDLGYKDNCHAFLG